MILYLSWSAPGFPIHLPSTLISPNELNHLHLCSPYISPLLPNIPCQIVYCVSQCFPATRILTHLRSCLFSDPCLSDYPACSLIPAFLTILPAAQPPSACLLLFPRLLIHQPASPAFDPSPA